MSIGQQAFIGAGGYGVIYLADAVGVPLLAALALAAVVSGLLALVTSFLVFRLVGGYFAIGTWVLAEGFRLLTTQVDALGGGSGLSLQAFSGTDRVTRIATVYWVALALAVLVVVATYLLMRSPVGLGLTAIRDDVKAASSLGVHVRRWQAPRLRRRIGRRRARRRAHRPEHAAGEPGLDLLGQLQRVHDLHRRHRGPRHHRGPHPRRRHLLRAPAAARPATAPGTSSRSARSPSWSCSSPPRACGAC